jgi:hypothetical protein
MQTEADLPRLPNAPSMKMICVYGHGKDTEVRLIKVFLAFFPIEFYNRDHTGMLMGQTNPTSHS